LETVCRFLGADLDGVVAARLDIAGAIVWHGEMGRVNFV
jgi:hypothetical protein